jgi:mRNA interferase RelE/StbE
MYKVEIVKSAIKELSKISSKEALWVLEKIETLKENPRPQGSIKLTGSKDEYRIRVGNYRVLYTIEDTILFVQVFKIGHRKDVY